MSDSPTVLIIGATSAIATEVARCFAQQGSRFFLAARSEERMTAIADDLRVRGAAQVETYSIDLTDLDGQQAMLDAAQAAYPRIDYVLVGYGTLGDQGSSQSSVEATLKEWDLNATSTIALLTRLANLLEGQRSGVLAVISSVAGDRGRRSNYIYGAAKAALSTYLSGLRARLAKSGVRVITIKPGMVDTPMTAHMRKGPLFASPQKVGADIHTAMTHPKRAPIAGDVLYTPGYWRLVMLVIRAIPEPIFRRLPL